jgi:hypothetical protein
MAFDGVRVENALDIERDAFTHGEADQVGKRGPDVPGDPDLGDVET